MSGDEREILAALYDMLTGSMADEAVKASTRMVERAMTKIHEGVLHAQLEMDSTPSDTQIWMATVDVLRGVEREICVGMLAAALVRLHNLDMKTKGASKS